VVSGVQSANATFRLPFATDIMDIRFNHITVCICTFKRPTLLLRSLDRLGQQVTGGAFSYSIVVADNDRDQSVREVVTEFASTVEVEVLYCVEPRQNIALVRNAALSYADGDFVAFIDDDEVPGEDWLFQLFSACQRFGSDGVLGPVNPYFDSAPPSWVKKGKFFDRPSLPTGYELSWPECRTGNVLFRGSILDPAEAPFRSQFGTGGEDVDFFHRMTDRGFKFVWCGEAAVNELVPPSRCRRSFLLKRALLRGSNFPKYPGNRVKNVAKSLAAVPLYTIALPFLALAGQHLFLKYLFKLCDHTARLLSLYGVAVVRERES
jgi:succinoglycan biosynthesis protein ExoM